MRMVRRTRKGHIGLSRDTRVRVYLPAEVCSLGVIVMLSVAECPNSVVDVKRRRINRKVGQEVFSNDVTDSQHGPCKRHGP